jgi:hypothetical protein
MQSSILITRKDDLNRAPSLARSLLWTYKVEESTMKIPIVACAAAVALLASGTASAVGDVAYVSYTGGEPWGMPGNVNALNDVFGTGNWDRLYFPTAVGNGLWDYGFILMDGGDGADEEFVNFVNSNRADMENWVAGGGSLIINAARWYETYDFDLGFGITLHVGASDTGTADDTGHPIFDGPYGYTGDFFDGDSLAHDYVTGDGLTSLMTGDVGGSILAEKAYGSGHVIAGGLTLPFFGEHDLWTPNCAIMHRNLLDYGYAVPAPGALALLALAGCARRRRR